MTTPLGHPPPTVDQWLSERDRGRSLASTLTRAPADGVIRVFAYGSLMWSPCFVYLHREPATVLGYRRRFSIWTIRARGTPQRPGLGLGLVGEPGECRGLVYTLDPAQQRRNLHALWEREMATGAYRPCWLPVHAEDTTVTSLVFVADPAHRQFAGILSPSEVAGYVAHAQGGYGSCRDYLATTVAELEKMDAPDAEIIALLALVDAVAG